MITSEVNMIALATAANAVVGEEQATKIAELYRIIDDAMFAGYELGKMEGIKGSAEATEAAFDNGFDQGEEVGRDEGYDDGYLEGVRDARANPAVADAMVADIIDERGEYEPTNDDVNAFLEPTPGCDCDECDEHRAWVDGEHEDDDYCEICDSYDCPVPMKIGG